MPNKLSLEPLYQSWRINQVLPDFVDGGVYLDVGCGYPPELINRVKHRMKRCIGVDIAVTPTRYENVEILNADIQTRIRLPSRSVNIITMLAVLEHMKHPQAVMNECYRLLKPGGVLLVTVPSPANKPLVEFLAAIGLLRKEMIEQHENYFTKQALAQLSRTAGFAQVEVRWFELGLNTFLKAVK